ncbi:hypothetical protein P175DRAFT_0434914 [Aspergillus ochraceoroseus IBT 24754]|uniref:hydroxymethylglutaryl-CoA lyase n=2 Tax=Aspergillus subgen. Nidulantes TaxID=2720870 RepID=A0A0F8UPT1_9EURO|nr:uncharacterized protein P175DRAFT_0434914 [Aspergillus ochraceoroseus IBT 24754]KKK21619.1 hypothetical protein ARAM_006737 [Aspergillus rambellii]PTU22142.1 hypothetical protein P175DRAFT_0434914 [Aspergillus ochraceoroseus IBT 24754]
MKPPSIRIVEVSPRDGLQNIPSAIPTAEKIDLIRRLAQCGLTSIELTSVVSPRAVPQLADCREILDHETVRRLAAAADTTMRLPVLVPNAKGLEIALQHGAQEVAVFVSATEGFSRANTNCSVREGIERARCIARKAGGVGVCVRGYISCIFTDPFSSAATTPPSAVLHCTKELLSMGCYEISLGDTLGTATPGQVRSLLAYLSLHGIPMARLAGHFHDTYGRGLANVWEAYRCGIRVFDSSVAGLGGCPFAPGAAGNVATEDVVEMFCREGIETGVDWGRLLETRAWVEGTLLRRI